jgi:DNA-binding MarR family transcriptional regulator
MGRRRLHPQGRRVGHIGIWAQAACAKHTNPHCLTAAQVCVRIQNMNAQPVAIKKQEYDLLEAIAEDELVTQANLSARLGMAVGSVNWYVKRLVNCGYLKVSHMDRTRLKYQLTPEGMAILTQRTLQYMRRSLVVYAELRQKARAVVTDLRAQGVTQVYLEGDDEVIDILRLTCIEQGLALGAEPDGVLLRTVGQDYLVAV